MSTPTPPTPPSATAPSSEAQVHDWRARRRRARRHFNLSLLVMAGVVSWFVLGASLPEWSDPALSAKPAPSPPYLEASWLALDGMQRRTQTTQLAEGDTLAQLLARHGVSNIQADAALDALREVHDPRRLRPGQKIRLYKEWHPAPSTPSTPSATDPTSATFAGLDFIPRARHRVIVRRVDTARFEATRYERILTDRHFFADVLVSSSVYEAARSGGMAPRLVVDLIRLFSFTTDFQRDIREGDRLEVLYTRRFDAANKLAEEGEIIFAALTNRGTRRAYWQLAHLDGTHGYYDDTGRSVRRLLMQTPVDGARLSSHFGARRHPILGYTRVHRGLDFAAPRGTPIFAAGDGEVVRIGRNGNYGNYIRLRHRNGYETAYAHMSRYAQGLKKGARVRQGETIGYVGRTGLATGPHLHYEVWHRGKAINPRQLKLPSRKLLNETGRARLAEAQTAISEQITRLSVRENVVRSLPRVTTRRDN